MSAECMSADDLLKEKMLGSLESKTFNKNDREDLLSHCNLTNEELDEWLSHFHFRSKNLSESEVVAYLRKGRPLNPEKANFFYVSCLNVERDFVDHVLGPVYKTNGKYTMTDYCGLIRNEIFLGEICFMEAAIKERVRTGVFFIQFDNGILEAELLDLFQNCGGLLVDVMSFSTERDALEGLKFVLDKQKQGAFAFVHGECPAELLSLTMNEEALETLKQEKLILKTEVDKLLNAALKENIPAVAEDEQPLSYDDLLRENVALKNDNDLLCAENVLLKQEKRVFETEIDSLNEEKAALEAENAILTASLHDFTTRWKQEEPAAKRARDA